MFGLPVAAYIQYCIEKCAPLVVFGTPAAKSWRLDWFRVSCFQLFTRMSAWAIKW